MNFFFSILTTVSFLSAVFGDRQIILDLIRKTYENEKMIRNVYSEMKGREMINDKINPCRINLHSNAELANVDLNSIDLESEILAGDFDDRKGFRLILDDSTTLDIPAVIKCVPKYKDGRSVIHYGKAFVFFLLYYQALVTAYKQVYPGKIIEFPALVTKYEKVYPAEIVDDNKSVFILGTGKMINHILQTYNTNREEKRRIKKWFDKAAKQRETGKNICESVATLGQTKQEAECEQEIEDGIIEAGAFPLYITKNIKVEICGIIICTIKYSKKGSDKGKRIRKYFTVAKIDEQNERKLYTYIRGSRVDNKIREFALHEGIL